MKESLIQKACMEYLAARRIPCFRMNSGTMLGSYKGKSWAVKLNEAGTADLLALVHMQGGLFMPVWLEIKNEKGKQSELQRSFEDSVLAQGMKYFIIRDVDGLELALDSLYP